MSPCTPPNDEVEPPQSMEGWRRGAAAAVSGVRGWRCGVPRHAATQAAAPALGRGRPRCDLGEEVRLAYADLAREAGVEVPPA